MLILNHKINDNSLNIEILKRIIVLRNPYHTLFPDDCITIIPNNRIRVILRIIYNLRLCSIMQWKRIVRHHFTLDDKRTVRLAINGINVAYWVISTARHQKED